MLIIMCAMAILLNTIFVGSISAAVYKTIKEDQIFGLGLNLLFLTAALVVSFKMSVVSYDVYKNYDEIKVLIEE